VQKSRTKADHQHFSIQPVEFFFLLAQLCHMLTADQSTQVAQKDQQDVAAIAQSIFQRDGLAIHRL
jgi:hypothetical protein